MIRCHLSRLMGERRVRLIEVARATGVSRNMLAKLYYDRAVRIDLADLEKLCSYFQCSIGDFFERIPGQPKGRTRKSGRSTPPMLRQ
jgi:putative transcriptional regulator